MSNRRSVRDRAEASARKAGFHGTSSEGVVLVWVEESKKDAYMKGFVAGWKQAQLKGKTP